MWIHVGAVVPPLAAIYGQSEDVTPIPSHGRIGVARLYKVNYSSAATNPEILAAFSTDIPASVNRLKADALPTMSLP